MQTCDVSDPVKEFAEALAEETRTISCFSYFGELNLGGAWAFSVSTHRDADILTRSNFEVISSDLEKRFPGDVEVVRSTHWGSGWQEDLAVRVLDDDGVPTPAAHALYEWRRALQDYPVADDEHHSRLEWEESVENVRNAAFWNLNTSISGEQAEEVFRWISDNKNSGLNWDSEGAQYPTDEALKAALAHFELLEEE
jgi:hypothetical protein